MALENGSMSPADMAAVMGNNNGLGNDGFGGWWMMLWLVMAMMMGWGNGFGGYSGNVGSVPYTIGADLQRGFDQQATSAGIASLQAQVGNGFADNALAQCQGNANTVAAITGAKDSLNGTLYANQLANNQAMNGLAMSLQNCCCQTQSGIQDLKYVVATENCQDRQALNDGLRDLMAQNTANTNAIVQSQNSGFQSVLDKLCQLELDNVKQENERLRTQLNMAGLAASQISQTSQILQGQQAQAQAIINSCCPKAGPAYLVPNPNGCGCNGGFAA